MRRAELDTTNAQWSIDAGNFYDKMSRRYNEALPLYRRALRYAEANEGPNALRTAKAHNNIAYALTRLKRYDEALSEQQVATTLYTHIYGEQHPFTAARLINLGAIHYYLNAIDSAQAYFTQAEAIYTAIEQSDEIDPRVPGQHADLLNNQAAIDVAQGHLESAYNRLAKALTIVPQDADQTRLILYQSMSAVCELNHKKDEAHH